MDPFVKSVHKSGLGYLHSFLAAATAAEQVVAGTE
jgi:hypothetical protein